MKKLLNIAICLSLLILSTGTNRLAATNFSAWQFKSGHNGISGSKLEFTEKSMTLEMWVNMDEGMNEGDKTIISGTMDNNNKGYLLSLRKNTNNEFSVRFFALTPSRSGISFYIPKDKFTGKWGHMAFVISEQENKAYAYINGELYEEATAVGGWLGNSNVALSIGNWYSDPKFYGEIADFRIWKTARTASQIRANYNKQIDGNEPGLVVNYTFSDYNATIQNAAGSNNHAECRPAANWKQYYTQEVLAYHPVNLVVNNNLLTWEAGDSFEADNNISGNYIVHVEPEPQKNIRNPLTGWVLYGSTGVASDFWTKLDNIHVPALSNTVKIENYANTLYMRISWAVLNPHEDVYAWQTDDKFKWMVQNARQRGMRLAFRVVPDSRDKSTDFTPAFVKEAGAQGFTSGTSNQRWSPYPDDPVFQEKYGKFIRAFAQEYNDPDVVDFIDGYGLGKWGEAHDVRYIDNANREAVFKWVVDLYTQHFTKIPMAINYHRLVGYPQSWGAVNSQSEALLDYAFNKGYILRHDAFGMTDYYQSWEKRIAAKWLYQRPVIMEGGWIAGQHSWWNDPRGYETIADMRQGEFDDSREAHVNMMDFRVGNETQTWFNDAYHLVEQFIAEGGYRFYPDSLSLPEKVYNGANATIIHRWNNLGWGYCPTNLPVWNQKYKVAFALLDDNNNIVSLYVDEQTDLSTWLKDEPATYRFTPGINNVPAGHYMWATAIIDTTKNNEKGLNIAAKRNITTTGWLKLMEVEITSNL